MVRAFVPCGSSITLAAPNSATMAGTPTCTPVAPYSTYNFGPKGSCKVKLQQRIDGPCFGNCGAECADLKMDLKCRGIEDALGNPISAQADTGWTFRLLLRITLNEPFAGDSTVEDFQVAFQVPDPNNGGLKLKQGLYSTLGGFVLPVPSRSLLGSGNPQRAPRRP